MSRAVLVVDDDPMVLEVTTAMLRDLGCDALPAHSASEALAKLAGGEPIDILITDVNMPDLSGYQLAEQARRLRDGLQVILLSGRETEPHGFPLIRKPFLSQDLARVMKATTGLC